MFLTLPALLTLPTRAASSVSAEEAHAIRAEAYLYFYPLVTMEVTRQQLKAWQSGYSCCQRVDHPPSGPVRHGLRPQPDAR